jgi:transposase
VYATEAVLLPLKAVCRTQRAGHLGLRAQVEVITTPPQFARQIKGRPKTDKRDCQWIQRLHKLGMLPSIFQPNEATHALRDYVRQRANLVRLSGQHIQRMQKALESMNLKLTKVLGDITGVTGLKIIRAIVAGERNPRAGQAARQALQAYGRGDHRGPGRPLPAGVPVRVA